MDVGDAIDLMLHRLDYRGVAVTEARHRGATRGVEVLWPGARLESFGITVDSLCGAKIGTNA